MKRLALRLGKVLITVGRRLVEYALSQKARHWRAAE
jgi:hypothetical protein